MRLRRSCTRLRVIWAICALAIALLALDSATARDLGEPEYFSAPAIPHIGVSPSQFSSNDKGDRDSAVLTVTLEEPSQIKLSIVSAADAHITDLHGYIRRPAGPYRHTLTGMIRDARGELKPLPEGTYYAEATVRDPAWGETPARVAFQVNNTLRTVSVTSDNPDTRFSPNGDGWKDGVTARFDLSRPATVTMRVRGPGGQVHRVRRSYRNAGTKTLKWNGLVKKGKGSIGAPEGSYTVGLQARPTAPGLASRIGDARVTRKVVSDLTPPSTNTEISAQTINSSLRETVTLSSRVTEPGYRRFRVVSSAGEEVYATDWQLSSSLNHSHKWGGRDSSGRTVAPGSYTLQFYFEDVAGNLPDHYPVTRTVEITNRVSGTAAKIPWSGWWWPRRETYAQKLYNNPGPLTKYDKINGTSAWAWEYEHHRTTDPAQDWWGHCQAWAAAAIMEPQPQGRTIDGVEFSQDDVEALYAEAWSRHRGQQWGSRYKDQGLNSEEYTDVYPAEFDEQVRYWIGEQRTALLMDFTTSRAVWNYPVYAFERTSTFEGNAEYVTMRIRRAEPVYGATGTVSKVHTFYYTLRPGTDGVWYNPSGSSVNTHPDYIVKVTRRGGDHQNPYIKLDTLYSMFR